MKQIAQLSLILLVGVWTALGQNAERNAPRTPPTAKSAAPSAPSQGAASIGEGPEVTIVENLKGVVIVDAPKTINPAGARGVSGLLVRGPGFLIDTKFAAVVAPYLGAKLTNKKLAQLQQDIILFARKKDYPVVDVLFEEQEIVDGVIQVTVLVGKAGKVTIRNVGEPYFSSEYVASNMRLHDGDTIRESTLLDDINWLNRNPFRQVDVKMKAGEVGKVDLDVDVKDRYPFRAYFGFEDSLTRVLDSRMWYAGFNWGDAFKLGRDHQLNYQFSGSTDIRRMQSHSASYLIPLPWRHNLTLYGSHTDVEPDMAVLGFPGLQQKGESWQLSARYEVPLPRMGPVTSDLSVGFDYKNTDNNLEFGGTNVFKRPTEIGQIPVGYHGYVPDAYGQTTFGGTVFFSPGGLFNHNTDTDFGLTRFNGTKASYYYVRLEGERDTKLPWGFTWVLKGTVQLTDDALLPSEQIGVGGYSTVRGYEERFANGDHGWVINNELRTPSWKITNLTGNPETGDYLQFLLFYDAGSASLAYALNTDDIHVDLSAVGAGLRYTIARNASLRLDYGYQLQHDLYSGRHQRGHVGFQFNF